MFLIAAAVSGTQTEMDSDNKPSTYSAGSVELNSPAYPTYQMVVCFLEKVIQTNYLTEMARFLATPDAFLNSWKDGWDEWLLYLIGFCVCVSIGIFLFLAMFVICCCHCCCCNSKSKQKKTKEKYPEKSDFSRCYCVSCSVIMLVVVIGMIVSIIPMFTMNNRINTEISEGVWTKLNQSIDGAYSFLVTAVEDINDVLYDGYVQTETKVFDVLYALPAESFQVLENSTGLGAAITGMVVFTNKLPDLQSNLTVADNLTLTLQNQQDQLETDLDELINNITNSSSCIALPRPPVCNDVENIAIVVDFYQVNLTAAVQMVDYTINSGFTDLVLNISKEVLKIMNDLNATIIPAIDSAANQSQEVKNQITDAITNLNETVTSLEVDQAKEQITTIQNDDAYVMAITITYWVTLSLVIVLAVITALFVFGLLFGTILPYSKGTNTCCSKSCGGRWLQSGSGMNFVFYWLYMLLLVLLFVVGGLLHTEACRHVTKVESAESFEVLKIFDNWVNQSLYANTGYNVSILPFDTYRLCNNDTAIYTALHLEEGWNLTQIALDAEQEINKAFDEIKNMEMTIPPIDLTDPIVDEVLRGLDTVFGPNGLNFTAIVENLERSIVEPNLTKIIEDLNAANMTSYADDLQDILQNTVLLMESEKQELIRHLKIVESIVTAVSFLDTAQTFNSSEAVINENGTALVSDFVNKTADNTEAMLVKFIMDATYLVENDVARCLSLYTAVEQTLDSACVYFLYAVNGLWFCLGSCTFFLLISVLITPTLVKMYRSSGPKPKTTKAYDDKMTAKSDTTSSPLQSAKAQEAAACAIVSEQGPPLKTQPQQQISAVSTGQIITEFPSADHIPAGLAIAGTTIAVVEKRNHDMGTEQSNQPLPGMIEADKNPPFATAQHQEYEAVAPPSYSSLWPAISMTQPFVIPRQKITTSQIHPRSQASASGEPLYDVAHNVYKNDAYEPPIDYY